MCDVRLATSSSTHRMLRGRGMMEATGVGSQRATRVVHSRVPSTTQEWDPAGSALVTLLAQAARGPRREGVFALWLTVRVAQDLLLDPPFPERAHRRRVAALEHRLTSLTMAAPLRRAIAAAITELREGEAGSVPVILSQLVAPARDILGAEAAEAVALAVRGAKARKPAGLG